MKRSAPCVGEAYDAAGLEPLFHRSPWRGELIAAEALSTLDLI